MTYFVVSDIHGFAQELIDALDDAPQQNKITLNWTGRLN